MAFPALIQKMNTNPSVASTQTVAGIGVGSGGPSVQAGDSIIVLISSTPLNNFTVSSVTDNQSNTYTQLTGAAVGQNSPFATSADIWWTPSVASTVSTLTVTVTYSGSAHNPVSLYEVSNLSAATVTASSASGINASSFNGPSLNGNTEAFYVTIAAGNIDTPSVSSPWVQETANIGNGHTTVAIAPYFHGTQQAAFTIPSGFAFQGVVSGAVFVLSSSTFNLSGNVSGAGGVGATVSYSGPQGSGSTTADGSGNYSFTGLNPGNYTVTAVAKSGYLVNPPVSQNVSLSVNTSGVNFTTSLDWSPTDCRNYATFPNTGILQPSLAVFYTGQTSSDSLVPPTDSRAAGAPVDSRAAGPPINNRKNPNP